MFCKSFFCGIIKKPFVPMTVLVTFKSMNISCDEKQIYFSLRVLFLNLSMLSLHSREKIKSRRRYYIVSFIQWRSIFWQTIQTSVILHSFLKCHRWIQGKEHNDKEFCFHARVNISPLIVNQKNNQNQTKLYNNVSCLWCYSVPPTSAINATSNQTQDKTHCPYLANNEWSKAFKSL